MKRNISELEREADRKLRKFDQLYMKLPKSKRRIADKIYLDIAEGRLTFEQGLKN